MDADWLDVQVRAQNKEEYNDTRVVYTIEDNMIVKAQVIDN